MFAKNKYNAKKSTADGYSFSSKLERAVYEEIKSQSAQGKIELIKTQDHVLLTKAEIKYIPDFKCRDLVTGDTIHIEAKGFSSERWPTIKKLWKHYGPGKLLIYKGSYAKLNLDEVIIPEPRMHCPHCLNEIEQ